MVEENTHSSDDLHAHYAGAHDILIHEFEKIHGLPQLDLKHLLQELGMHHIKLERQNEELLRGREELEVSRRRYAELFELAPIGYILFDTRGVIRDINVTGAELLGFSKQELIGKPFSVCINEPKDINIFEAYRREVFIQQTKKHCEMKLRKKDHTSFHAQMQSVPVENVDGNAGCIRMAISDITERVENEEEREKLIRELQEALVKVKLLSGFLPICASCKKIRNDQGYWQQLEAYISEHSEAEFSHGMCPGCAEKVQEEINKLKRG